MGRRGVARLGQPIDAVVLGMGGDGHTASFFPDAETLPSLLAAEKTRLVVPMHAAGGGEPRLTLTMPAIANAGFLALHIEGDANERFSRPFWTARGCRSAR